jgi:transcriptional regulator with XRE-family HTH domain
MLEQLTTRLTDYAFDGEKLRTIRQDLGLTQKELAYAAGFARYATISEIETGVKTPLMPTIELLAELLDVRPGELIMYNTVGKLLKAARVEAGLNSNQLMVKTGVTAMTIANIEADRGSPRINTLRKLAAGLGISARELIPE